MRQRMEEHRVNPACAVCHKLMDPLGFALENFDAIGGWRDTEAGSPIDSSGVLPDGTQFQGASGLSEESQALIMAVDQPIDIQVFVTPT